MGISVCLVTCQSGSLRQTNDEHSPYVEMQTEVSEMGISWGTAFALYMPRFSSGEDTPATTPFAPLPAIFPLDYTNSASWLRH